MIYNILLLFAYVNKNNLLWEVNSEYAILEYLVDWYTCYCFKSIFDVVNW